MTIAQQWINSIYNCADEWLANPNRGGECALCVTARYSCKTCIVPKIFGSGALCECGCGDYLLPPCTPALNDADHVLSSLALLLTVDKKDVT